MQGDAVVVSVQPDNFDAAVDYRSFDKMGHSMHGQDPQLFTDTLVDWASKLPSN